MPPLAAAVADIRRVLTTQSRSQTSALSLSLIWALTVVIVTQPAKAIQPFSQASTLVAHGFAVDNVVSGPSWTATGGVGRFAMDAEHHRVWATIPFQSILLLEDAVYVHNEATPEDLGPKCRKYLGGEVRRGAHVKGLHPLLSYLDQYFCQWIQPSPCSWASVLNFYKNLNHTATVTQGSSTIDVFWTNYNISIDSELPFASSFPKTVELQYNADGVLTHLSHWTSNQKSPPFRQNSDISHSDDDVWNITRDVSNIQWKPDPLWNCTVVP